MDLSKFKPSDWLRVGGGIVMLIAYFLTWWKLDFPGVDSGASGSDYFFTGTVPWLLILAIAVLTFLSAAGIVKLPRTVPWPLVYLGAAVLSFLLVLIRFFSDGVDSDFGEVPTTRGAGLYLALLSTIVVAVGCFLGFRESGGNLNDLTDVNKLKSSFSGHGGSTPPPPGGPRAPPPPPPYQGGGAPPPPPPPSV